MTGAARAGEIWPLIQEERNRLGDVLQSLYEPEWNVESLCQGWLIRDVVAHCIQTHLATPWNLARELIASGLSVSVRNERGIARRRSEAPADLLTQYRKTAHLTRFPRWEAPFALAETVIHGYDIAWPLGRPVEVPAQSLITVCEACCRDGSILGGKRRAAGLTLRATDVDWSAGAGSLITGPLASIIMAITGRPSALDTLSGEGVDILRSRI